MSDWAQHAIWWQIYPLGFLGADTQGQDRSPRRTLDDLVIWLDYAVELGVSGIALGPIFRSATHGYDTVDYFSIDERLGDRASFDRLVEACRARGLRLLLDGVFNHVGVGYPAFERIRAGHAGDADRRFFVPDESAGVLAGAGDEATKYRTFEGHPGLIALNHARPEVADLVATVMNHWLSAGADGWRLDAAYAVPPAFWAEVLPRVRRDHPDAYFVGEVIHGDYADLVQDSHFDSVTQYELWKAIWSSLNDGNLFELAWAIKRHNQMLSTFVPLTFVGNHDVTRLATRLIDERHLSPALVLLFTLAGTPTVYYGDEQGFRGTKRDQVGGDDEIRPSFPAEGPSALAPYGWPIYRLHQRLIGFRRRHPWLHRAEAETVRLTNTFFAYECRDGDSRVLVALNLSDTEQSVEVPAGLDSLLHEENAEQPALAGRTLTTPPHQWAIAY